MRINNFLKTREKDVLVVAHRGSHGGNIIQNHIYAYQNALQQGADVIECDVILSKDKQFYAFHHNQERELLHIDEDIETLTSDQIDELILYNAIGGESGYHICTLDEVIDTFKDTLINIDRGWFHWEEIIDFLNKKNNPNVLLKSHVDDKLLSVLQEKGKDLPYMPILNTKKDLEDCLKYDLNFIAFEIIFDSLEHELVQKDIFDFCKERNILTFVNAEKLSMMDKHNMCADLDDNNAIINGFDSTWGKLVDMGFDIIQTDWALMLKNYINSR